MLYEEKKIETIPVGPLGLIPLRSCTELGKKVDDWLVTWRRERESEHKSTIQFAEYQKDSYIHHQKNYSQDMSMLSLLLQEPCR